jgi:RIC1
MDEGIIIGAEHESSVVSNLPFVTFRLATSVRIGHVRVRGAFSNLTKAIVAFVSASQFAVLLTAGQDAKYNVTVKKPRCQCCSATLLKFSFTQSSSPKQSGEDSTTNTVDSHLPSVIEFWTISMSRRSTSVVTVIGCARKTEMAH